MRILTRWAWSVGLVLAAGAACSGPSSERVEALTSALNPVVSKSFDVDTPPTLAYTDHSPTAATACSDQSCYIAWKYCAGDEYYACYVYGTRIDPAGGILDARPQYLGKADNDSSLQAGTNNQGEFLVVWSAPDHKGRFARIRANDGAIIQQATPGIPFGSISSNGANYVIQSGFSVHVIENGVVSGPFTVPGLELLSGKPAVVPGPNNQYLFAWSDVAEGLAVRFDSSTGTFLDTAPLVYTKHYPGAPRGVFSGGVYTLGWGALTLLRIHPDGTVIDADDDFNGVSTAKKFGLGTAAETQFFKIGDKAFYVWRETGATRPLYGVHVDPANAALVDGDAVVSLGNVQTGWTMSLGSGGGFALANLLGAGAVPLTWKSAPFGLSKGTPVPFVMRGLPKHSPALASDGTSFLVTWVSGTAATSTLSAVRMSATGQRLDPEPFAIATGSASESVKLPAVTFDGTSYLVSWVMGTAVFAREVHTDGSLGATPAGPLYAAASTSSIGALRAVFNGTYHWLGVGERRSGALGARVELVRVEPGTLLASTPVSSVFYEGARFGLVGDTTPAAAYKTVFATGLQDEAVYSQRVRSETQLPQTQVRLETDGARSNLSATDGATFLVAWEAYPGSVRAALVEPLSGQPLTGFPQFLPAGMPLPLLLWHDGLSYVFLGRRPSTAAAPEIVRFSPTLSQLDPSPVTFESDFESGNTSYVAAHDKAGHSAVAYTAPDPDWVATTIKVRFITNDGSPAESPAGNEGGAGGVGGAPDVAGGADSVGMAGSTGLAGGGSTGGMGGDNPLGGSGHAGEHTASTGGDDRGGAPSATGDAGTGAGGATDASAGTQNQTGGAPTDEAGAGSGDAAGTPRSQPAPSDSGCSCRMTSRESSSPGLVFMLALLARVSRTRRARCQRVASRLHL
jgi:hypothetical protein